MEPVGLQDPYGSYFFALEIDGVEVAHFQEFSGIKTTAEVFEIQEGGRNGATLKRPGQSKFENLILKYATNASLGLLAWRDEWLQDRFTTRSGSISIRNNRGEEVRRFSFTGAWPVSWEGPSLRSSSSDLAIETLEIAIETLQVHRGGPLTPDRTPQLLPAPLDADGDGRVDGMEEELASRVDRSQLPDHDTDGDGRADGMEEQQAAQEQAQRDSAPTSDDDGDGRADGMEEQQAAQEKAQRDSAPSADADGDGQADPLEEEDAPTEPPPEGDAPTEPPPYPDALPDDDSSTA